MCDLWNVFKQGTELALGATLGVVLQRLATREHEDNDEARPVFADDQCRDDGRDSEDIETDLARNE